MTNKNVIEIIDRLMTPTTEGTVFTSSEVFTAITHGYYYIRPGEDNVKFIKEIDSILKDGWKHRSKMYRTFKNGVPYEEWLWTNMARKALAVMRSMFDEGTYAHYKEKMHDDMDVVYDDEMLKTYLYYLDINDLKEVFSEITTLADKGNWYISKQSYEDMMTEFRDCCVCVSEWEFIDDAEVDESREFINNTPDFFFYYLCRETIIDIIYRHIDMNTILIAHMIKAYVNTEEMDVATAYTDLAVTLMCGYCVEVFDPIITDANKMTPEIFKKNDANTTFVDGTYKFTIGFFAS